MKIDKHFLALCALLVAVILYVNFLGTVKPVPLPEKLANFPQKIGDFKRVSTQEFSEQVLQVAGVDEYIMWQYRNRKGYTLGLYIGYYRDQTEGSIIHSPKHCMPGSGWEPTLLKEVSLTDVNGRTYGINRMVLQKGMDKQIAHYWYQGRGRILANEYIDRALMIWDSIIRRRSDGSLVRITGPGDEKDADIKDQMQFMAALMPVLDKFLPR
jgi:EpsI family protein